MTAFSQPLELDLASVIFYRNYSWCTTSCATRMTIKPFKEIPEIIGSSRIAILIWPNIIFKEIPEIIGPSRIAILIWLNIT